MGRVGVLAKVTAWCFPVVLMSVLSSCAYIKETLGLGVAKPRIHLAGITVVGVAKNQVKLLVALQVENPNNFSITLSNMEYRVNAAGLILASGKYDESFSVPDGGKNVIKLPLQISSDALMLVLNRLLNRQDVVATVTARAFFDTPISPIEVNFEEDRKIESGG